MQILLISRALLLGAPQSCGDAWVAITDLCFVSEAGHNVYTRSEWANDCTQYDLGKGCDGSEVGDTGNKEKSVLEDGRAKDRKSKNEL